MHMAMGALMIAIDIVQKRYSKSRALSTTGARDLLGTLPHRAFFPE